MQILKDKLANKSLTDNLDRDIPSFVCLCSGAGSNMLSILNSIKNQELNANPLAIISNVSTAKALTTAKQWEIETFILPNENSSLRDETLTELLQKLNPDFIILAGYLKKIPLEVIKKYHHKILNIHPSLLPKHGGKGMYGINVHKSVISHNEKLSGATVHLVTENYDEGPVILQEEIPVDENDTAESLAKKVLQVEHQLFPKAIKEYLKSEYYSLPRNS